MSENVPSTASEHEDPVTQRWGWAVLIIAALLFAIERYIQGEIIEDYPDDKPYPSCLIYGDTFAGAPVHSVWAYNQDNQWAVLITVYRPDPKRWIDWRIRRPKK